MFYQRQFTKTSRFIAYTLVMAILSMNIVGISAIKNNETVSISSPTLNAFASDLTQFAQDGRLRVNQNFNREADALIKVLSNGTQLQPVIIDDNGENQNAVAELLAYRIAKGDVPASLKGKSLLRLETISMFSEKRTQEENSQIAERIFNELSASNGETILFINELTTFVGNSRVNDALTKALQNGKVKIIGGSSTQTFSENIETQAEVAALFEKINIEPLQTTAAETVEAKREERPYRGDKVSADLREMMQTESGEKRLDVILQAKNADNPVLREIMANNGVNLNDRIGNTDTIVVSLPLSAINALANSGLVNYMSPDREMKSLGHIETTSGTSLMRSQPSGFGRSTAYTLDGAGVGVAVIDSGIYTAQKSFMDGTTSSRVVYSQSFIPNVTSTEDDYGHGTHVASILAGSASRDSSAYKGIAPKANLINLKVLNSFGIGTTSSLLNALDWVIANRTTYNIRVVNLSLGTPAIDAYANDPVCLKVQQLNLNGILVVAAAGNNGKNFLTQQKVYGQVHSPGNDPSVLTVGASNSMGTDSRSDDVMSTYSSHGPTRSYYTSDGVKKYDNVIKPDIVAPGNRIVAAKAKSTSTLISVFPSLTDATLNIEGDDNDMMYLSGTSMSTPVAAGTAALLFQMNPKMTPTTVKMLLEYSAQPLNGVNMLEQGAGQLNTEGAIKIARTYKFDTDFNSYAKGNSLLQSGQTFPTASSTVGGTTFAWSQGILANHIYLKGVNLASKYQEVYDNWYWFEDGIKYNSSGTPSFDGLYSSGITINQNVLTSNGTAMGGGSIFCASGVLISDGVLVGDGVLFGDGVLISDGVLVGDGVLVADVTMASTNSVLVTGDNTAAMH